MTVLQVFEDLIAEAESGTIDPVKRQYVREKIEAMTIIVDTFIAGMVPYQLEGDDAIGPERMRQMKAAVIRYDPSIEPVMRRWDDVQ